MTTRATIIIDGTIRLYRHADGYPEGLGKEIRDWMESASEYGERIDPELMATSLVKTHSCRPALCEHGDEEYRYDVNTDACRITVFHKEALLKPRFVQWWAYAEQWCCNKELC